MTTSWARVAHGPPTFSCPANVSVGDAVYLTAGGGVDRARADSAATMSVFGFVASKPTTTTCSVTSVGSVGNFSLLTPGSVYFVSTTITGGITGTAPSAVGHVVQQVGIATSSSSIVIQLGSPIKL